MLFVVSHLPARYCRSTCDGVQALPTVGAVTTRENAQMIKSWFVEFLTIIDCNRPLPPVAVNGVFVQTHATLPTTPAFVTLTVKLVALTQKAVCKLVIDELVTPTKSAVPEPFVTPSVPVTDNDVPVALVTPRVDIDVTVGSAAYIVPVAKATRQIISIFLISL